MGMGVVVGNSTIFYIGVEYADDYNKFTLSDTPGVSFICVRKKYPRWNDDNYVTQHA